MFSNCVESLYHHSVDALLAGKKYSKGTFINNPIPLLTARNDTQPKTSFKNTAGFTVLACTSEHKLTKTHTHTKKTISQNRSNMVTDRASPHKEEAEGLHSLLTLTLKV